MTAATAGMAMTGTATAGTTGTTATAATEMGTAAGMGTAEMGTAVMGATAEMGTAVMGTAGTTAKLTMLNSIVNEGSRSLHVDGLLLNVKIKSVNGWKMRVEKTNGCGLNDLQQSRKYFGSNKSSSFSGSSKGMKLLVEPLIMNAVGQNLIVKSVLQGCLNHLFAGFWDGEL
jgi:hypothetical protein